MTDQKRKKLFWLYKIAGIFVSCAMPIWAILEKFPIWAKTHGTGHSVSVGIILIAIVLLIVFRRTVFDFIRDHFDLKHAPPLLVWLVLIVISYIFIYIGEFMSDLNTVLWMGFVGCCAGTVLTFIADKYKDKDVTSDE